MGFLEDLDRDKDGTALDDGFAMGADLLGAGLSGLGEIAMVGGGSIAALGAAASATGVGAFPGLAAAAIGGGIALGGAGLALEGSILQSDVVSHLAAGAGDFTADLFGTRDKGPAIAPGTGPNTSLENVMASRDGG
jgi:hypothetical protein